ncbi:MAG: hypothetical protein H6Q10_1428 [Acidobacteria bacterium]|nr:hypothetical protein [Acidobacteriota bacterium]
MATNPYGPLALKGFVFGDAASVRTRAGSLVEGWRRHLLRSAGGA